MNQKAWHCFSAARDRFRGLAKQLLRDLPDLQARQQELIDRRDASAYPVETPVVFNRALDAVEAGDTIKFILAADNPGRQEQRAEIQRYLAGPSGRLAENFFRDSLGIDFRREVLILNKTPIHTPRTADLRELCRMGGPAFAGGLQASQRAMAGLLVELHQALRPLRVWIIGYSELKTRGIFAAYWEALKEHYQSWDAGREELFLYRHFSMNQFALDLQSQAQEGEAIPETLSRIGRAYRLRIMGW